MVNPLPLAKLSKIHNVKHQSRVKSILSKESHAKPHRFASWRAIATKQSSQDQER
jgi:hypothetical protein